MDFKAFTVADLKAALLAEDFWLTKTLPITKHRAISFCHNPRADKDDIVLLVAYQENQVIGYLGVLPDKIYVNRIEYKLGWLTGWWVDPAQATKGVGAILLFKALNAYHQHLGVSGASKLGRKALKASQKFMASNTITGLDIRLRFDLTGTILRKFPKMKMIRILFKIIDAVLNEIVDLRGFFWERRCHKKLRQTYEYVSSIDEETGDFIQRHHQQDLTRKGKAEFNWMLRYPWLLSAPIKDSASRRYYFTSRAKQFTFLAVKVFAKDHEMIGFFILKVRDDRMSVIFSYFDGHNALFITAAVVYTALAMEVSTVSLYDERLVSSFSALRCPHWSTRAVSRGFLLSKSFADFPLEDYRLHGGDGDLAFY